MRVALALALLVLACRANTIKTVGDGCTEVLDAFCDRAVECGAVTSRGQCWPTGPSNCCEGKGICSGPASTAAADLRCADDIRTVSCPDIADTRIAASCLKAADVSGLIDTGTGGGAGGAGGGGGSTIWLCSDTVFCPGLEAFQGGSMPCAASSADARAKDTARSQCTGCTCSAPSCTDSGGACH